MSSYWTGYGGTVLALTPSEYETFMENYMEKNDDVNSKTVIEELMDGEFDTSELQMLKGSAIGTVPEYMRTWYGYDDNDGLAFDGSKYFSVNYLDKGTYEGFGLFPYVLDGKPNERMEFGNIPRFGPGGDADVYLVWADRQPYEPKWMFEGPAYGNYGELLREFKGKMEAYLPAGFDWDAHIGICKFAAYA